MHETYLLKEEFRFILLFFSVPPTTNFTVFIENSSSINGKSLKIRRRLPNELLKRRKTKCFNMQRFANCSVLGKIHSIFVLLS